MPSHKDVASGKIEVQRRNESLDGIHVYGKTTNFIGKGYVLYGQIAYLKLYISKN